MLTIGIDAHHRMHAVCILDQSGTLVKEYIVRGGIDDLVASLAELKQPFRVAFEASTTYGLLHDKLAVIAQQVVVAHPGKLRLIYQAKRKSDRIDARKIAMLLLIDELPAVHVPKIEQREWRSAIEFRACLVNKRTRAKNGLRALLRTFDIKAASRRKLWSTAGRAWLRALELVSPLAAMKRDELLEEVEYYDRAIRAAEKKLDAIAKDHPHCLLLRTIPGVGARTAEAMAAYIDIPQRFKRSRSIGAYIGLVPRLEQSGNTRRMGRITHDGPPTLRKLLTEAAWQGVRRSPTIKAFYERVKGGRKERRGQAVTATARHLAKVMVAMLKNNEPWRESVQAEPAA